MRQISIATNRMNEEDSYLRIHDTLVSMFDIHGRDSVHKFGKLLRFVVSWLISAVAGVTIGIPMMMVSDVVMVWMQGMTDSRDL